MTTRISDLVPGDRILGVDIGESTFIGRIDPHPLYANLVMVIWWLDHPEYRWSFDALAPGQVVLFNHTLDSTDREGALRRALHGGQEQKRR